MKRGDRDRRRSRVQEGAALRQGGTLNLGKLSGGAGQLLLQAANLLCDKYPDDSGERVVISAEASRFVDRAVSSTLHHVYQDKDLFLLKKGKLALSDVLVFLSFSVEEAVNSVPGLTDYQRKLLGPLSREYVLRVTRYLLADYYCCQKLDSFNRGARDRFKAQFQSATASLSEGPTQVDSQLGLSHLRRKYVPFLEMMRTADLSWLPGSDLSDRELLQSNSAVAGQIFDDTAWERDLGYANVENVRGLEELDLTDPERSPENRGNSLVIAPMTEPIDWREFLANVQIGPSDVAAAFEGRLDALVPVEVNRERVLTTILSTKTPMFLLTKQGAVYGPDVATGPETLRKLNFRSYELTRRLIYFLLSQMVYRPDSLRKIWGEKYFPQRREGNSGSASGGVLSGAAAPVVRPSGPESQYDVSEIQKLLSACSAGLVVSSQQSDAADEGLSDGSQDDPEAGGLEDGPVSGRARRLPQVGVKVLLPLLRYQRVGESGNEYTEYRPARPSKQALANAPEGKVFGVGLEIPELDAVVRPEKLDQFLQENGFTDLEDVLTRFAGYAFPRYETWRRSPDAARNVHGTRVRVRTVLLDSSE